MKKTLKMMALLIVGFVVAGFAYGTRGYLDAVAHSKELKQTADLLLEKNLGGKSLGTERYNQLLAVQDPTFEQHHGLDLSTPGAGITTISQSLAKRIGFEEFKPGIGKIRQTGYALGLENELSKEQIMALWLDTLEMGRGPNGWIRGFHKMSEAVYGKSPRDIEDQQFLTLVAVLIAPGKYTIGTADKALEERVARISRLVSNTCTPISNSDVWLEGCS